MRPSCEAVAPTESEVGLETSERLVHAVVLSVAFGPVVFEATAERGHRDGKENRSQRRSELDATGCRSLIRGGSHFQMASTRSL